MKLIKLLKDDYSHPITCLPGAENLTLEDTILVSDAKYRLLQFNRVRMIVVKEFSETNAANMGSFDKMKAYILSDIIKVADYDTFDPSKYEVGDYVLVYEDVNAEKPGEIPVMRKPLPGFAFTPEERIAAMNEYEKAMKEYYQKMEAYNEAVETFIKETASKPQFGYLIEVLSETNWTVIADISFETTKTEAQFGVLGKMPKEVATKVTEALGDLKVDDSIKGLTIAEVISKALKLEDEEEIVGTLIPKD